MSEPEKVKDDGTLLSVSKNFVCFVNGRRIEECSVDPLAPLVDFLRNNLRLTGTKIGCNEGGCGACTVMISDLHPITNKIRHYSVNSCLTPVAAVFGKAITTIEGIGCTKKLHAIQERFFQQHGAQCGFCSPGFLMAMYALLCNNPNPTTTEIDESLQGNLCRCTGYRPILSAFYSFARNNGDSSVKTDGCGMGGQCCMLKGGNCAKSEKCCGVIEAKECSKCACQQLIFPPELQVGNYHKRPFHVATANNCEWFTPTSLEEFRMLKENHPRSKVISGYTELGVDRRFFSVDIPVAIFSKQIPELHQHFLDDQNGIFLGAALSLTDVSTTLKHYCLTLPEWKCSVFREVIQMLHWFAGTHVRNAATIAGNIATATPVSDLNPIWMACGASLVLSSRARGKRTLTIDQNFFTAYRQTLIQSDEIIEGIWIPFSKKNQYVKAFKQSQRREDDITIVSGAFSVELEPDTDTIREIKIAYSGMDAITRMSQKVIAVVGRAWNSALLDEVLHLIVEEFSISAGAPGGMERYRISLAQSFFLKFFVFVNSQLKKSEEVCYIEEKNTDAAVPLKGTQVYEVSKEDRPVGETAPHHFLKRFATGAAEYGDDIGPEGALHMAFVLAPIACGTLNSIDLSEALKMPGVYGYIDHSDVREGVIVGGLMGGTGHCVFPKSEIEFYCQPLAAIFADSHEHARCAAGAVKVDCTSRKPILTIKEAIAAKSYLRTKPFVLHSSLLEAKGDKPVEFDYSRCSRVVEGSISTGGQEHFYFETQNIIVVPHGEDELEVYCGTQCVTIVQKEIALALGLPQNKIVVKVKQIGGGFGGKDCCEFHAVPAAIAALKFRKTIKFSADRYDDMAIYGNRHPSLCNYKAAISEDGKLQSMQMHLYLNCGYTHGISFGVLQRALAHSDSVYRWQNADVYGHGCKTNLASNTAFRGFGAPQAMFAMETMLTHIAETYHLDINKLRIENLYDDGDYALCGVQFTQCNAKRCWDECLEMSDYEARAKAINLYNKSNRYSKKGIYIVPAKFHVAFGVKHMNQAGAVVHVYSDGSVLISHAGMEMGQGLHTKMIQVAARTLGIEMSKINIMETSTDKVPNTSPTAASSGSDLNGLAIIDACEKINARLEPLRKEQPEATWEKLVITAYLRRISLSASGFGRVDITVADFETGKGANMFAYTVYGVACSEVVVDCLTGDHRLLRADISMDLGQSLNPAIDIGQIEGAFMQGYGLFTMEEIKIQPDGTRLTRGPSTYKIPAADDVPRQFNIRLLAGSFNKSAIFSSKAAGEPPLFLGASAFFAIREAIRSFRSDRGLQEYFRFDAPATCERIRMACEDEITARAPQLPPDSDYSPWTVTL